MASPKTPEVGLTPSLHRIYQRYKSGTAIVIDWLVSRDRNFTSNNAQTQCVSLPVGQILSMAKNVADRRVKAPMKMQRTFKRVLADRRYLTNTYEKGADQSQPTVASNERHKHFNDTLAEAYDTLFPNPANGEHEGQPRKSTKKERQPMESANRFDVLTDFIDEELDGQNLAAPFEDHTEGTTDLERSTIADDPLAVALSLHAFVLEIEGMLEMVRHYWKLAAQGLLPIAFAGWLNNLAYHFVVELNAEYGPAYGFHGGLVQEVGHGFVWPCTELYLFWNEHAKDKKYMALTEHRRIEEFFNNPSQEEASEADFEQALALLDEEEDHYEEDEHPWKGKELYDARYQKDAYAVQCVLRSIVKLRDGSSSLDKFWRLRNMAPLLEGLTLCFEHPHQMFQTSHVVGLHFLLESCKAFIWSSDDDRPNKTNCRINVLQFVKEVAVALDELFTIDKDHIMGGTLDSEWYGSMAGFNAGLKTFTSQFSFDLYSQIPWVAGSQMSAILGNIQQFGLQLLNRKGILGSMLHMYNMLRCIGLCPILPILEVFCEVFGSAVFLGDGSRPKTNFNNRLNVYLGGTVEFRRGRRANVKPPWLNGNDDVTYQNLRIHPHELTFLAEHCMPYALNGAKFWAQIATDGKETRQTRLYDRTHGHNNMTTLFRHSSRSDIMEKARNLLERDFEGQVPLGKLNCFKVYNSCLEIWKAIATRVYGPDKAFYFVGNSHSLRSIPFPSECTPSVEGAMIFFHTVVSEVDTFSKKRRTPARLNELPQFGVLRDALVGVCEGKEIDEFLWKRI